VILARFLFVVPPFEGHVNPTVPVARQLTARGHYVAWVAHPTKVRPLLPEGSTLIPLDDRVPDEIVAAKLEGVQTRGLERLKFLLEDFLIPLAKSMVPGVDAAVDQFQPNVVVADQQAFAGAIVARRRGLAWATSVTTSAAVVELFPMFPKVEEWRMKQLAQLQREAGLPAFFLSEISPRLVIIFSSKALVGVEEFPPHFQFVGPSIGRRPDGVTFPWERLQDKRRVLITAGTVNVTEGEQFFRAAVQACADLPIQIIMVASETFMPDAIPENILVRSRIPQLDILPHVNAVVCHGGHNTVCEALAHDLPLVVIPIKDDQATVAQQVVNAGAGIRLKFRRLSPVQLRDAVERVLCEDSYREAAARIQKSFEAAGGAARTAELLEALATHG
jgi:MGT family glycosyltransferase